MLFKKRNSANNGNQVPVPITAFFRSVYRHIIKQISARAKKTVYKTPLLWHSSDFLVIS
jgi:hypothetical protein